MHVCDYIRAVVTFIWLKIYTVPKNVSGQVCFLKAALFVPCSLIVPATLPLKRWKELIS